MPKKNTAGDPGVDNCLHPHVFTEQEMKQEFPLAAFDYKGLALYRGNELVAYLCMELPPGPAVTLHLWIPRNNRSKENIGWLVKKFYSDVHPWVKEQDKDFIVVNCPYEFTKTKELFSTFGFDPKPIWLGVMQVQTKES